MPERVRCRLNGGLGRLAAAGLSLLGLALFVGAGCQTTKSPAQSRAAHTAEPSDSTDVAEAPDGEVATVNYQAISERDPFKPLVVSRKVGEGAPPQAGGSGQRPAGPAAAGGKAEGPKPPPDPTADLALTGITETTDGLQVLVERMSTGEGQYARVGDVVFGFKVDKIGPDQVSLSQGGKTFDLKLGQKDIAETTPTAKPAEQSSGQATSSSSSSASSATPAGPPGGMTDWRSMSEDQRRQAMEQRRQWWEGLSDDQRNQYRSRMGGGRGGGGGFRGAGPRGRGG